MDKHIKTQIIAVTLGDVAGIGPEIVVKALSNNALKDSKIVVVGNLDAVNRAIKITNSKLKVHVVECVSECIFSETVINLIDVKKTKITDFEYGKVSATCGQAAYDFIEKAIELVVNNQVSAIATAPINKESLRAANVPFIGHTEIFEYLTHTKNPLTLFETNGLRVFFLTRHLSLRDMLKKIKKDFIVDTTKRCFEALEQLGVTDGTMAIAGLNPHCGEHGLFGYEELNEIAPAVARLQDLGYNVKGPIGADSVFHQAAIGKYNSVLSLYHDQGHIATKTLDFEKTISITCGMPILRTSVDHGTAFDVAGKNIASDVSMIEAIVLAKKYCKNF